VGELICRPALGSGKTTFARRLSEISGLPRSELDGHFWQRGLSPLSPAAWSARQEQLVTAATWIMDGDLGPYDVLAPRLATADTIFLLALRSGVAPGDHFAAVASVPTTGSGAKAAPPRRSQPPLRLQSKSTWQYATAPASAHSPPAAADRLATDSRRQATPRVTPPQWLLRRGHGH
jgi:hypothetical protein